LTSRVGRWLRARRGVDKHLAVYGAYWFRGYSCNPRAIYEKARELVPEMRGVWVAKPGAEVPEDVECVRPGTREYYDVLLPALKAIEIEYAWEGLFARTPDGLPYIGTHRRYPHYLFALGYGGNGMTFGFLAARLLLDAFLNRGNQDDLALFKFGRFRS